MTSNHGNDGRRALRDSLQAGERIVVPGREENRKARRARVVKQRAAAKAAKRAEGSQQ